MLRIKFERLARGWNQAEVGRRARIPQSDISLIELGRLTPSEAQLQRLVQGFSISPAFVLLKDVFVRDPEETTVAQS